MAVNGEGKQVWVVIQWCGDFFIYKGILMMYEMVQRWDSSLGKSEL